MGEALDLLLVALARYYVPPYLRMVDGQVQNVDGYWIESPGGFAELQPEEQQAIRASEAKSRTPGILGPDAPADARMMTFADQNPEEWDFRYGKLHADSSWTMGRSITVARNGGGFEVSKQSMLNQYESGPLKIERKQFSNLDDAIVHAKKQVGHMRTKPTLPDRSQEAVFRGLDRVADRLADRRERKRREAALSGGTMGKKVEQVFIGMSQGIAFEDEVGLSTREFPAASREKMAKSGSALPGGGFPIPDIDALKRAIQSIGRAKNPAAAKAHIKKRAAALGATNLIPEDW
jgi:hypothetical protein